MINWWNNNQRPIWWRWIAGTGRADSTKVSFSYIFDNLNTNPSIGFLLYYIFSFIVKQPVAQRLTLQLVAEEPQVQSLRRTDNINNYLFQWSSLAYYYIGNVNIKIKWSLLHVLFTFFICIFLYFIQQHNLFRSWKYKSRFPGLIWHVIVLFIIKKVTVTLLVNYYF